jgi:membrane-bound lytic murein transglycosylase F
MKHRLVWGLCGLVACQSGPSHTADEPLTDDFHEAGVEWHDPRVEGDLPADTLVIGIHNAITSLVIYRGAPLGVEYDLLKLFSEQTGVPIRFVMDHNRYHLIQLLEQGKIHMAAGFYHSNLDSAVDHLHFTPYLFQKNHLGVAAAPKAEKPKDIRGLAGKEVWVAPYSRARQLLVQTTRNLEPPVVIRTLPDSIHEEQALFWLQENHISYLVTDEPIIRFFEDQQTDVHELFRLGDENEPIAWIYQDRNPSKFQEKLNRWIEETRTSKAYRIVISNYTNPKSALLRQGEGILQSEKKGQMVPFEQEIKWQAEQSDIPWELLAAQVRRESRFNPDAQSRAHAVGLMQITPIAAKEVGYPYHRMNHPATNLAAGTALLKKLDAYWQTQIPDSLQRLKFVLASYNAGMGHIEDARRLARKRGLSDTLWEGHVETVVAQLSKPAVYRDPACRYGYCRGSEPVQYVSDILRYHQLYQEGMFTARLY